MAKNMLIRSLCLVGMSFASSVIWAENEASYNPQNGRLVIPKVLIGNDYYQVEMKNTQGLDFTVSNYSKLANSSTENKPLANVESLEINILESFPVQVNALAKGHLMNGCQQLDELEVEREDNLFKVSLSTRSEGEICTQALVPFTKTIALNVLGLKAGSYQVDVNGVKASFELAVDNIPVQTTLNLH